MRFNTFLLLEIFWEVGGKNGVWVITNALFVAMFLRILRIFGLCENVVIKERYLTCAQYVPWNGAKGNVLGRLPQRRARYQVRYVFARTWNPGSKTATVSLPSLEIRWAFGPTAC